MKHTHSVQSFMLCVLAVIALCAAQSVLAQTSVFAYQGKLDFGGADNTTGSSNTFFGIVAGANNTTGKENAFFAAAAGSYNTTGTHNTFIGYFADFATQNPTGDNNTLLGYNTKVNSGVSNSTAIGANASVTASNTIALGTSQETVIVSGKLQVDTLAAAGNQSLCLNNSNRLAPCSSSLRYKSDLQPFTGGLSLLNRLQPVSFTWKDGGLRDVGFGAEDVHKIEPLLVTYNSTGQVEGLKYDRITVVLVNALKEQQQQIAAQQIQIAELNLTKAENARLKAQLADIVARLEQLEKIRVTQQ
jgi:trimeric autotransporter adhesin